MKIVKAQSYCHRTATANSSPTAHGTGTPSAVLSPTVQQLRASLFSPQAREAFFADDEEACNDFTLERLTLAPRGLGPSGYIRATEHFHAAVAPYFFIQTPLSMMYWPPGVRSSAFFPAIDSTSCNWIVFSLARRWYS